MDELIYKDIVNSANETILREKADKELEYQNTKKKHKLKCLRNTGIAFILFFIVFKISEANLGHDYLMLNIIIAMIIGAIPICIVIATAPTKPKENWHQMICNCIKEDCISYFAELFDMSVSNIEYDVDNFISRNRKRLGVETVYTYRKYTNPATGRINTEKTTNYIEHFWLYKDKVDFVYDKLYEKYHKRIRSEIKENLSIEKSKLQNEQLSLKNENLKVKINLTKPWTCNFCGNMNRGDDMSCIKCGGIRPSEN